MTSGYDMRSVMRTLFMSDFFRSEQAYFAKSKIPLSWSSVRSA